MQIIQWAAVGVAILGIAATRAAADEPLKAMTFNIRYGTANDGENRWPLRREAVAETIRRCDPDLLGVQEALDFQLDYLDQQLDGYEVIGVGRDDGRRRGEFAALLVRSDRLEVVDWGTRWLSDRPEEPGSKTWGGDLPRIYTWANLRDKPSGRELHVVNAHWDHRSQESREKSAQAILEHLDGVASGRDLAIVMGDFNAGPENPAIQQLRADGSGLRDTWAAVHPDAARPSTFNGFRLPATGPQIDWLLVGPGWQVQSAAVIQNLIEGKMPSDHFPMTAVIRTSD
ncbi:Endonuclease/Exonuclease/phosphatase family protein [Posidoniimonas polymericola]|uniref:Endonuclease/Exonuclease/phosphatase family protein n=1 Tax=Posidoniimonas polymericola TaxID=2528002 RepID=A0A5C5YUF2_9BACT|nr:endonuclease/exonuclease/phosphatase family protein [Posidoniimonas polymericola]TWT78293.1 Endonuclease/Exonuclease/phosphatase family protein [Posidoniimonas polymericola]